jgi:Cu/Ag efflux protein CusF
MAHQGHQHAAPAAPPGAAVQMQKQGGKPSGTGTVNTVDAGRRTVTLTHGPIPAIGWPAMTMDFAVAPGADLSAVQPGAQVMFTLSKGADGVYQIDHVMPAGASMGHGGHGG